MPQFPFISFCCEIQIGTLQEVKRISYFWWDSSFLTSRLAWDRTEEEEYKKQTDSDLQTKAEKPK